jgi:F0F1-type ATP synthase membrane subunit c/vacuolar-type H+-ATPase subunit K
MDVEAARMIGAGLAVFALLGVGLGIGQIFSTLINAIARNPSLTEAVALFALLIAFLILFK